MTPKPVIPVIPPRTKRTAQLLGVGIAALYRTQRESEASHGNTGRADGSLGDTLDHGTDAAAPGEG